MTSRCVPLLLAVACVGGCGGESPEEEVRAAVDEYVDAVRDKDAERLCEKLFPSTLLPAAVVDRLDRDLAASPDAAPDRWEAENRSCSQEFGDNGEFESADPPADVPVLDVTLLEPFEDTDGITGAARARVRWDGPQPMELVRFDDDWKIVFEVR